MVGKKFKKVPAAYADAVAAAITRSADVLRMPWLVADRPATPTERAAAVMATTVLLAHERFKTERRKSAASRQEAAVLTALGNAGYVRDQKKKPI